MQNRNIHILSLRKDCMILYDMENFLTYLSHRLSEEILSSKPLSGGDISAAWILKTSSREYFLKVNRQPFASEMFHAEQQGLETISATHTIRVPRVFLSGSFEGSSFLLMEYIESKHPDPSDYRRLGTALAKLHQQTHSFFGFSADNFIGSLPQRNRYHTDWPSFYWQERILPQFQLALKNELLSKDLIPQEKKAINLFQELFSDVKPSLLHGDLWGGNYLIATDGTPCLIDPALYYGHSMVDIAMSRLFGGFSEAFYDAYHEMIPKTDRYNEQIDLYQLYYLLVHLNLFGSGYYSSVSAILKRYF